MSVVKHDLAEAFAEQLFIAQHGHSGLRWEQMGEVGQGDYDLTARRFLEGWWNPDTPFVVLDLANGEMWLTSAPPLEAPAGYVPAVVEPTDVEQLHLLAGALDNLDCSDSDEVGREVDFIGDRLRNIAGRLQVAAAEYERMLRTVEAVGPLVPPDPSTDIPDEPFTGGAW
jgi:hypothetical protein